MSRVQRLPKGASLLAPGLAVARDASGNVTIFERWNRWRPQLILSPVEVRRFTQWVARRRFCCSSCEQTWERKQRVQARHAVRRGKREFPGPHGSASRCQP